MSGSQLALVLDAVVKASVILLSAALATSLLRRAPAAARHLIWSLGLAGALAAPVLSLALPHWQLPIVRISAQAPAPEPQAADLAVNATDGGSAGLLQGTPSSPTSPAVSRDPRPPSPPAVRNTWAPWSVATMLWAIGAMLIIGRMLVGLAAVQWMSRRMQMVTDAPWLDQARALAARLGLSRVRFLRTDAASMPMAWGILRPSVLMPADADDWPAERLRIVLLHELAHVKRRDCVTHLFAQLACAAYWFHPLAWMAARRLRTERERACDDLVLAAGTDGPDYADQLLDIARVMRAGRFPAVLAGASLAMAHRSQLEGRLMAILDPTVPRRGLSRARAAAATLSFALLLVPVAAVQPWAEEASVQPAGAAQSASAPRLAPAPQPEPQPQPKPDRAPTPAPQTGDLSHARGQGIGGGVAGGIVNGVAGGIAQGIADGVVGGISNGIAEGIAGAISANLSQQPRTATGKNAASQVDPRTIAALIEALKDSDKDVRETALSALARMRDPRVFEPLTAALKDASSDVREQAAFGLGQLRDPRAVQPLSAALKDTDADVREQAVFALGQLRAATAIEALTAALHDAAPNVREQAAFALGQIRDPRAVDPLISALKDDKNDVREQAAFALGQLRDPRAVEALVIALKDSSADVREQAAFALGQIRDPRAVDGLTAALKDPEASVRQQAAFALGQIR